MPFAIGLGDPFWTFDTVAFEQQIATFAKNNSITTQTQWLAAITGITAGQQTAAIQALLKCVKCSAP